MSEDTGEVRNGEDFFAEQLRLNKSESLAQYDLEQVEKEVIKGSIVGAIAEATFKYSKSTKPKYQVLGFDLQDDNG